MTQKQSKSEAEECPQCLKPVSGCYKNQTDQSMRVTTKLDDFDPKNALASFPEYFPVFHFCISPLHPQPQEEKRMVFSVVLFERELDVTEV